jgi:hypothetical protein
LQSGWLRGVRGAATARVTLAAWASRLMIGEQQVIDFRISRENRSIPSSLSRNEWATFAY